MKNSSEIGNRTCDLPACSAVPQPTAPPHAPTFIHVHALNGLSHKLELRVEINKIQKHPKLSCIKIGGLFQNFGNGSMGSFLRVYLLFKVLRFKNVRNTLNIRRHRNGHLK